MEKLIFNSDFCVDTLKSYNVEYKIPRIVIRSGNDEVTTRNALDESVNQESTCNNSSSFKIALNTKYPKFEAVLVSAITEDSIESGVHYLFEDKFDEFYKDNSYMAIQLLQYFLRDYYTDIKKVKAVLHIVSHYTYEQMGQDFVYPILSLINHTNKGIKKFALKVFDNWDSIETLSLLKGTDPPKERWLCEYKERIINRLERKKTDAIFFTSNQQRKLARTGGPGIGT